MGEGPPTPEPIQVPEPPPRQRTTLIVALVASIGVLSACVCVAGPPFGRWLESVVPAALDRAFASTPSAPPPTTQTEDEPEDSWRAYIDSIEAQVAEQGRTVPLLLELADIWAAMAEEAGTDTPKGRQALGEALALYREPLSKGPDDPLYVRSDIGRCLLLLGRADEASAEFDIVLEADPMEFLPDACVWAGESYAAVGRTDDARAAFLAYLDDDPRGKMPDRVRGLLERLDD